MPKINSLDDLRAIGGKVGTVKPAEPAPDPAAETAKALRALADAIERQNTGLAKSHEALAQAVRDAIKPVDAKPVEVTRPPVEEHKVTFEYDPNGRIVGATIKARRGS